MSNIKIKSGDFRRGEVYYVRYDSGVGCEVGTGRPYVIVSSDEGNRTSGKLTVVPLTTSYQTVSVSVELNTTRRRSWALCADLFSLDKSRFGDLMCILTYEEMRRIDIAIGKALDLPINTDKNETLKQALIDAEKVAEDRALEIEILKKAYDRLLDKLVDQRIERDLAAKTKSEPVVEPKSEELRLVDINRCSFKDLRGVGFSDNVAATIITNRPYLHIEVLKHVPGVTAVAYELVKDKLTVGDVSVVEEPKQPRGEWDKPITWAEFKTYSHDKQVECLRHFKEYHRASSGMMAEMFGRQPATLSTYWKNNNLSGLLVHKPKPEDVERFREWLNG